ncbi:M56 family metallopeptidase [Maribacter arcticus]|nr:M56 family metallopeptidase [Maribacter arcticus]MDA9089796.1 M56 family metallopeptidase [Maribacter arcticus]
MIQYILECIAFQLLFLVIYDFFLKRETFFQWNRVYLLGTFLLSLILPWVKIEAFKQQVPQTFAGYPDFLWNLNAVQVVPIEEVSGWQLTWQEGIFYSGMFLALLFFVFKLRQVYLLKKHGEQVQFPNFTQVIITNSSIAFSFFKSIFIGDKVLKMKHDTIIEHELVHIRQGHTWDLLFFELMRIIGWFNPLVYVYQNRVSELHEFIADAHVAKEDKSEQYQQLLSQVFQTEHISFINQFFTKSLIKKRIVMLQKSKSKKVWQLKYLLLIPMVLGMLIYTSCELDKTATDNQESTLSDELLINEVKAEIEKNNLTVDYLVESGIVEKYENPEVILSKKEYFKYQLLFGEILENEILKFTKENPQEKPFKATIKEPSTKEYNSFVNAKKAYSLIDNNLKASIKAYAKDITYYDKTLGYPSEFIKFEVNDAKKLSISELQKFNELLSSLEDEPNYLGNIILYDDTNSFKIYTKIYEQPRGVKIVTKEQFDELDSVEVPFAVVDEAPIFPGCEDAADKRACFNDKIQLHISKNFSYPKAAQDANIEGRVSTMFMITSEGVIDNIKMRGPDKLLEDEVERIIKKLPKMSPGKQRGENVNVPFSIPVNFKLQ